MTLWNLFSNVASLSCKRNNAKPQLKCFMRKHAGMPGMQTGPQLFMGLTVFFPVFSSSFKPHFPSHLGRLQNLKPQTFRNPYDIPRSHLLDQLSRMRRNLLNTSVCNLRGQDSGKSQQVFISSPIVMSWHGSVVPVTQLTLLVCCQKVTSKDAFLLSYFVHKTENTSLLCLLCRPAPQRANSPDG